LVKTEICPCQELNPVRPTRSHFTDLTRICGLIHNKKCLEVFAFESENDTWHLTPNIDIADHTP
jgi:hypothetical protein